MKVVSRPLLGLLPAIEPTIVRVELTYRERALLSNAASLMDLIRDNVQRVCGDDVADRDPWIDLALGASGIRDLLEDSEVI